METADAAAPSLIAFAVSHPSVPIVPAARRRDWMDDASDHWPNRCLPLLIATKRGGSFATPMPSG